MSNQIEKYFLQMKGAAMKQIGIEVIAHLILVNILMSINIPSMIYMF